jgi:hypothetical protein
MVDDIHYVKGLPPVSPSGQVQRVNRKKRDDEKPPFEKYLNADDEEDKKKRRKKKKSDTVDVAGNVRKEPSGATESSNPNDTAEATDESGQKIIDVHV